MIQVVRVCSGLLCCMAACKDDLEVYRSRIRWLWWLNFESFWAKDVKCSFTSVNSVVQQNTRSSAPHFAFLASPADGLKFEATM